MRYKNFNLPKARLQRQLGATLPSSIGHEGLSEHEGLILHVQTLGHAANNMVLMGPHLESASLLSQVCFGAQVRRPILQQSSPLVPAQSRRLQQLRRPQQLLWST